MLLAAKIFNFIGALLLAWPALHALVKSRPYDDLVHRAEQGSKLAGMARYLRESSLSRFQQDHATLFLVLTCLGIGSVVAGFFLDLLDTYLTMKGCVPETGS